MAEPLIIPIRGRAPDLHAESWVAPNASLIGQVSLAARASVWYGATLRAEAEPIEIGFGSNIQDGVTIHGDERTRALFPDALPATGDDWSTEYMTLDLSVRVVTPPLVSAVVVAPPPPPLVSVLLSSLPHAANTAASASMVSTARTARIDFLM